MKKIILLKKKEGETPLEALENFRLKHKAYKNVPITYAGRLDPLVSGLLLLLAGDARMQKEKYLGLSKEYAFRVLFGFATDTHDILGKVIKNTKGLDIYDKVYLEKKIKDNLKFFTGKFKQKYPMYSSKTFAGKPLFSYARAGKKVGDREHLVSVKSLKFFGIKKISAPKFLQNIERRIAKVRGDFRQTEILKIWRQEVEKRTPDNFFVADFYIKCGSGTYVRGIADSLGKRVGIPALAFSIKRTKIGNWGQVE